MYVVDEGALKRVGAAGSRAPAVAPQQQYPVGPTSSVCSSLGRQARSNDRTTPSYSFNERPECIPLPKQASSLGPAAFLPASTFDVSGSGSGTTFPRTGADATPATTTISRSTPNYLRRAGLSASQKRLLASDSCQTLRDFNARTQLRSLAEGRLGGGSAGTDERKARQTVLKTVTSLSDWLNEFGAAESKALVNGFSVERARVSFSPPVSTPDWCSARRRRIWESLC